jgi:hypothetical protein
VAALLQFVTWDWQTPTPHVVVEHTMGVQTSFEQKPLAQSLLTLHGSALPQGGHVPPQSTSVSEPFCTPSEQLGIWQTPFWQTLSMQSEPTRHVLPSAHAGQALPPQSTAVSVPFLRPSLQVGGWQTPPVQTPLVQSEPTVQPTPAAHGGQALPPQSTPVSVPFFTPSEQVAAWHTPEVQTSLTQSEATSQVWPVPQGGQAPPPQSTAVSVPFCTPSMHDGDAQKPPVHTWLWQAALVAQCWPLAHDCASQPLAGLPSQSYQPALHETSAHEPVLQLVVALASEQVTPHPPQLASVVRSVSQPLTGL